MTSRQDLLTATQNIVNAVNLVARQLGNVFPQAAGIEATATSTSPVAFLTVQTSSGGVYKVGLYT